MRCYFFTNFMYSSIQQAIQPLHAVVDMFVKYDNGGSHQKACLFNWAKYHKTAICLNAGNYAQMVPLLDFIQRDENPYPFSPFYEDEATMGAEVLTSIAIVLPEKIYMAAEWIRNRMAELEPDPANSESMVAYRLLIDDRCQEAMSMADIVKMQDNIDAFGSYSYWETLFITMYLNKCGLAK